MKKQIILLFLIMSVFIGYLFMKAEEVQKRSKIMNFSHEFHVVEAEMGCTDCHTEVEESEKAEDRNLPEKDVCANCHDVEDEDNCTMCHVDMDNLESFTNPIRKFKFNHKKHVSDAKLSCDKCHPGMEKIDMGDGTKIPSREECNTCHNGIDAAMQCMICHTPNMQFRPTNHNPTWSREHSIEIRSGGDDCAHCHTNNFCQECHEATDLVSTKILPKNYYASFSPKASGEPPMVLKAVHELDYRFVHQLDASGKEKECRTCHETSSYCAQCHNITGLNTQMRPAWHGGPDWGALATAIGSGGGRHAELARRDIERCAACHDVQGADPTCLMCHTDFDGMRGTDPKTHESGFSNRYGESFFHDDDGAVCYTCHVNTHQRGDGFCGYCHN